MICILRFNWASWIILSGRSLKKRSNSRSLVSMTWACAASCLSSISSWMSCIRYSFARKATPPSGVVRKPRLDDSPSRKSPVTLAISCFTLAIWRSRARSCGSWEPSLKSGLREKVSIRSVSNSARRYCRRLSTGARPEVSWVLSPGRILSSSWV